jgi:hypothetical protein
MSIGVLLATVAGTVTLFSSWIFDLGSPVLAIYESG